MGSLRETSPTGGDEGAPRLGDLGEVSSDPQRLSFAEIALRKAGKSLALELVKQIPFFGKLISEAVEFIINTAEEASSLKSYFDGTWKSRTEDKMQLLQEHLVRMDLYSDSRKQILQRALHGYFNELQALKQFIESSMKDSGLDLRLDDVDEIHRIQKQLEEALAHLIQVLQFLHLSQDAKEASTPMDGLIAGSGLFALICKHRESVVDSLTNLVSDMLFRSSASSVNSALDRELCAIKKAKNVGLSQDIPVDMHNATGRNKDLLILVGGSDGSDPHEKKLRLAWSNDELSTVDEILKKIARLSTENQNVRVVMLNSDDSQQYKSRLLHPNRRWLAPNLSMIVWHGSIDQDAVADFTEGFLKERDDMLSDCEQWNVPGAFLEGIQCILTNTQSEENKVSLHLKSLRARKIWEEMLDNSIVPKKIAVEFQDSNDVVLRNVKLLKAIVQRVNRNLGVTELSFDHSIYFEIKFHNNFKCNELNDLLRDAKDSLKTILGDAKAEICGIRRGSIICSCHAEGTDIFENLVRKEAEMQDQFSVKPTAYRIQMSSLQVIRGNVAFAQSVQDELRGACDAHFYDLVWWLFEPSLPLTLGNIHGLARVRNKVRGWQEEVGLHVLSEFVCSEFKKLVLPLHMSRHGKPFQEILEALQRKLKKEYDSGSLSHFSLERFVVAAVNESFVDGAANLVHIAYNIINDSVASDVLKQSAVIALEKFCTSLVPGVVSVEGDEFLKSKGFSFESFCELPIRLSGVLKDPNASNILKQAAASALGSLCSALAALTSAWEGKKDELLRLMQLLEPLARDLKCRLPKVLDDPDAGENLKQAAASALVDFWSAHAAMISASKGEEDKSSLPLVKHFDDLAHNSVRCLFVVFDDPKAGNSLKQATASALGKFWSAHAAMISASKGEEDKSSLPLVKHFDDLAHNSVRRLVVVLHDSNSDDNFKQAAASALGTFLSDYAAMISASEAEEDKSLPLVKHFDDLAHNSMDSLSQVLADSKAGDNLKQAAASALGSFWSAYAAMISASKGEEDKSLRRMFHEDNIARDSVDSLSKILADAKAGDNVKQAAASALGNYWPAHAAMISASTKGEEDESLRRMIDEDYIAHHSESLSKILADSKAGDNVKQAAASALGNCWSAHAAMILASKGEKEKNMWRMVRVHYYSRDSVPRLSQVFDDSKAGDNLKQAAASALGNIWSARAAMISAIKGEEDESLPSVQHAQNLAQDWLRRLSEVLDDRKASDSLKQSVALTLISFRAKIDAFDAAARTRSAASDRFPFSRLQPYLQNRDFVLCAVKQTGRALQYAGSEVKKDKSVVLAAVKQAGEALLHSNDELKKDEKVVSVAVKQNGRALQYADEELKKDVKIVSVAVQQNGRALQYADDELKKDVNIVSVAVNQDWEALQYAGAEVKKDKSVVLAAVNQDWEALQYADDELKEDKDVISVAVKQKWRALQYAGSEVKKDKSIVLAAVNQDWEALQYADDELKEDKDVISVAVKQKWRGLQYAGSEVKKD